IWCGKKISYDIVEEPQQQDGASIQFRCEITIDTISYTATAVGPSKQTYSNHVALTMLTAIRSKKQIRSPVALAQHPCSAIEFPSSLGDDSRREPTSPKLATSSASSPRHADSLSSLFW